MASTNHVSRVARYLWQSHRDAWTNVIRHNPAILAAGSTVTVAALLLSGHSAAAIALALLSLVIAWRD